MTILEQMSAESPVTNNPRLNRFEILLEEGVYAFLEYHFHKGHMAIVHTEVPEKYKGKGIAGRLAREAFEYARRTGVQVKIYCPFVKTWIEKHPEFMDLISQN